MPTTTTSPASPGPSAAPATPLATPAAPGAESPARTATADATAAAAPAKRPARAAKQAGKAQVGKARVEKKAKPAVEASKRPAQRRPKPLALATPVAPWPPAAVTGGTAGLIPAVTAAAGPSADKAQVATQPGPRKAGSPVLAKKAGPQQRAKAGGASAPARKAKQGAKGAAAAASRQAPAQAAGTLAAKRAKKAAQPAADKTQKLRVKLVRDSFTMPQVDFDLIDTLKKRALGFGKATKKSELLRAGLQALVALDDTRLAALLEQLPMLKPGRPKKAG